MDSGDGSILGSLADALGALGDAPPPRPPEASVNEDAIAPSVVAQQFIDPQRFTNYYFNQTLCSNQIDIVAALTSQERTTITVEPRQVGKCLAPGTPILMYDGTVKKVEDIVVGDRIMGEDSTPRKVLSLARGREKMYRIVPRARNHEYFEVNESHILALVSRGRSKRNVIQKYLTMTVADYLSSAPWNRSDNYRGYRAAVDFSEKQLPVCPYWFGLWLGDGTSSGSGITNTDAAVIEFLRGYASELGLNFSSFYPKNRCENFLISSIKIGVRNPKGSGVVKRNVLRNFLKDFGLLDNKHIPNLFFANSRENRLKLLAGIIDTDGHKPTQVGKENTCEISFANKVLATDTLKLARSLGFRASMKLKRVKYSYKGVRNDKYTHRILIYGDLSGIPTRIKRKQWKKLPMREDPLLFGFDVKELPVGDYCGFTVDGNGLFLLGDFTVTHNTSSVAVSAAINCETEGVEWNKHHPEPYRIGIFAPKASQAQLDTERLKAWARCTKQGRELINWELTTTDRIVWHNGCEIRTYSASEQAENDGKTLNRIVLEEGQKISDFVVSQAILPMGGACVCAGTMVTDERGRRIPIEDFDGDKIIGHRNGDYFIDDVVWQGWNGEKECFRITTNSGRTLECSHDHPILMKVRDACPRPVQYVETSQLKVGTQIAVLDQLPLFGTIRMFDARMVGMLIGDGSYGLHSGRAGPVKYCSCDEELLQYVKSRWNFVVTRGHITKNGKKYEEGEINNSLGLTDHLRALGIYGQVKDAKTLPDNIDLYSKDDICELLGGLFDTDGCVMIEENRRGTIGFCSIGKDLVFGVFGLLEKLGIHGVIRKKKDAFRDFGDGPCFCRGAYELSIREKASIVRFHRNIKFLCAYKQKKLDNLVEILSTKKEKRQKDMMNMFFERIVKIEPIGIKTIYNLTAKFEHNYVANGIITHNTGARIAKIGTVRPIRNHFFNTWHNDKKALKTWHHWLICDNLLRGGYREFYSHGVNRKISQYVLDMMPLAQKETYVRAGIFPHTPDFYYPGDMELNDFLTQYELRWLEQFGLFLDGREKSILLSGTMPHQQKQMSMEEELYVGIDFATGVGADETAVAVWKRIGPILMKIWGCTFPDMPSPDQKRELINLFSKRGPFHSVKLILGDFGGNGAAIIPEIAAEANLPAQTINFGASDKLIVGASMNMKTSMYMDFKRQLQMGWLRYPALIPGTPMELSMDHHKGVRQWSSLEQEIIGVGINRRIQSPESDHDDVCSADILAVRAAKMGPSLFGQKRASMGNMPMYILRSQYR